jgi:hypothetical protein
VGGDDPEKVADDDGAALDDGDGRRRDDAVVRLQACADEKVGSATARSISAPAWKGCSTR